MGKFEIMSILCGITEKLWKMKVTVMLIIIGNLSAMLETLQKLRDTEYPRKSRNHPDDSMTKGEC